MRKTLFVALASAGLLAACGGGGDSSTASTASTSTTLSGVASKGPLRNAIVKAYAVAADGTLGALLKDALTDDSGNYTLDLGSYTGAVQLVVEPAPGKTLQSKDEATGQLVDMPSDFKLRATTVVAAPSSGNTQIQNASITPFTELATQIAVDSGGLTAANIAGGAQVVFNLIGVDPVATQPLDATLTPSASATADQKRYALWNAAVSQLAAGTPSTTDSATLNCFSAAGSDAGKRIQCASQQIAKAMVVDRSSGSAVATPAAALVGLSGALVSVAANTTINKVNVPVPADDAIVKTLSAVEDDVKAGKATPIVVNVPAETQSDVAKAKSFVARLRSNAVAMQSAPLDTGIADGVQAFGDSLRDEAAKVTSSTANLARLAVMARDLWVNYTSGATNSVNSPTVAGFNGGCTVYQGNFPVKFGSGNTTDAYAAGSTEATDRSQASWVGCSINTLKQPANVGGQPSGADQFRYRRSMLFNFGGATAGAVPYIAMTRKQFWDVGSSRVMDLNLLAAPVTGTITASFDGEQLTALRIAGDLPPGVDNVTRANAQPLAAKYTVNVDGALTVLDSGAAQLALAGGSFAVVPTGATAASLTLDLSSGGASVVVAPQDYGNAAQVAAARLNVVASLKTARGELNGTLSGDSFSVDANGDLQPGRMGFTGSVAAAGSSGTVATVLTGQLSASNTAQPTVGFEGTLALPSRPALTVKVSVTQTVAPTASTAGSYALSASYAQDAVSVTVSGTRTPSGDTLSLQESGGVALSLSSGSSEAAKLKVGGRDAATVDTGRNRVVYADGTFESIN